MLVYGAGSAWSRLFLPGAGAAKKSSGSATLVAFSVVDPNTLNLDPDPEFFYPICFWIRIQSYASNV